MSQLPKNMDLSTSLNVARASDSCHNSSHPDSHLLSTAAPSNGLNTPEECGSNSSFRPPAMDSYIATSSLPLTLCSSIFEECNTAYSSADDTVAGDAPFFGLEPYQSNHTFSGHQLQERHPSPMNSNINQTLMSVPSIQQYESHYDSLCQMSSWPQFELPRQQQILSVNSGLGIMYQEPELVLPSTGLGSPSSPPRVNLAPEQRELKRHRAHARRDSKSRLRRDRSISNPYTVSQRASPDLLPNSEYTHRHTPSPLLSQPSLQNSPILENTASLPAYTPVAKNQLPKDIYGPSFPMSSNDFTSGNNAYANSMPYLKSKEAPLRPHVRRPHSLSLSSIPDHLSIHQTESLISKGGMSDPGDNVRVVHSRPKPQCWDHGCNGRQFSTFSNLLRHQREKSGAAQKSSCPNCGAIFTRTTARNGHMAHDKCKQRRKSEVGV